MFDPTPSPRETPPDLDHPSAARAYNYLIGGPHHWAIDREFAKEQMRQLPDMEMATLNNRRFLARAVAFAMEQGITQFVDLGCGLPAPGQVHEVADSIEPKKAKVVYVDNEPVAKAHTTIWLEKAGRSDCAFLYGDLRQPWELWEQVLGTGVIDPTEPVALIALAVLHFVSPDHDPESIMDHYRSQLTPGSLLAISHVSDDREDEPLQTVAANFQKSDRAAYMRSPEAIIRLFGDWRLVDPGLTWSCEWRPDDNTIPASPAARSRYLVGVGVKEPRS